VAVRTWPALVTGSSETMATAASHKPVDAQHRPIMEFLTRRPGGTWAFAILHPFNGRTLRTA
jgi:hypothetical protein